MSYRSSDMCKAYDMAGWTLKPHREDDKDKYFLANYFKCCIGESVPTVDLNSATRNIDLRKETMASVLKKSSIPGPKPYPIGTKVQKFCRQIVEQMMKKSDDEKEDMRVEFLKQVRAVAVKWKCAAVDAGRGKPQKEADDEAWKFISDIENGRKILQGVLEPRHSKADREPRVRVSSRMRMKNQARVDLMMKFAGQGVPDSLSATMTSRFHRRAWKRKREKAKESAESTKIARLGNMIQTTLDFKMRN